MENNGIKFRIPNSFGQVVLVFFLVLMIGTMVILSFVNNSAGPAALMTASLIFGISAVFLLGKIISSRTITVSEDGIKIRYNFLFWNNQTYAYTDCIGYFSDRLAWWGRFGHGWVPIVFIGFKNGKIIKLKQIGDGGDYQSKKIKSVIEILESKNIPNLNLSHDNGLDEKGYAKRNVRGFGELKLAKEVERRFKKIAS
jgi:hypothetical protein